MLSIWRADELARPVGAVVASGHAALDAQLPAGGWPVGALVEVLQARNSLNEWRLLLPALVRCGGPVLLVGAPHQPFGPALAAQGLDPKRLLCVSAQTASERLWACEQALRCADVTAVLTWLPQVGRGQAGAMQVRPEQLRRLQMAASTHSKLLFVMRPERAREESSPATLRVLASGQDALTLHILKRRGPPLEQPLSLPARAARLAVLLAVSRRRAAHSPDAVQAEAEVEVVEAETPPLPAHPTDDHTDIDGYTAHNVTPFPGPDRHHVLDRPAAAA